MSSSVLLEANLGKENDGSMQVPGSVLARFLELRGRRVVKGCGALWYTVPGRFLMSLPYETMLNPEPQELEAMMRNTGLFGARFPSRSWTGLESGLYVLRRREYDISSVHVKHRPRVRHALKHFEFRPAEKAELISEGCTLNLSTMARQGRYDLEFGDPARWERFVEAAFTCPGISFPAVFSGSRLAAYMVTCREQKWLHILHQMSRQEDLPDFPNHLLTYSVTSQAASDASLDAVCYGYAALFATDGLHEYKLRFGYEMIPHFSVIRLHPVLNAVLGGPIARAAARIARGLRKEDQRLQTIQNILEGAHRSRRV